jgi:hypothetical protein
MDEQNQNNPIPQNVPEALTPEQPLTEAPQPVPSTQPGNEIQPAPEQSLGNNPEPAEGWQYQSGNLSPMNNIQDPTSNNQPNPATESISWSASEFVHHEKPGSWYVYMSLAALVLAVGVYFATKEIFSVVVIILIAVAFGVFGAVKPKVLEYAVGPKGIQVGNKHFSYEEFRSFAVLVEGALPGIQLLPQKRLALAITMYCEPKNADKIIEILGEYLPLEHRDQDLMDKFASKIHF